jgi:hypothetical protein
VQKLVANDPDWRTTWQWRQGHKLIVYNAASLQSVAMLGESRSETLYDSHAGLIEKANRTLNPPENCHRWARSAVREIHRSVADHVELRDASDPDERERIKSRQAAERDARLNGVAGSIHAMRSGVSVVEPQVTTEQQHLPVLAAKARALMTQNDPDMIRAGLAEIADALDALSGATQPEALAA